MASSYTGEMAQMKLVVTFQHNTRVCQIPIFLVREVKREMGFEHSGCGEAIWYSQRRRRKETNSFFVPVYNTSTLHEMQEFYYDEIVQQLDEIGDPFL